MAATERPPLRGGLGQTRVLTVAGRRGPRARPTASPPRSRSRSVRRARPGGRPRRRHHAHPGNDFELAAGFPVTEGLIALAATSVASIRYCDDSSSASRATTSSPSTCAVRSTPSALQRNFYATSSCGVCGKASIDQIEVACAPSRTGRRWRGDDHRRCPTRLRDRAARVRADRRPARDRACSRPTGELALRARGRRAPQRAGQGGRRARARGRDAARASHVALVSGRASSSSCRRPPWPASRSVRRSAPVEPRGRRRDAASA